MYFRSLIGKGKKILDLGARDCALTSYFNEGNEVLAVDIDGQALEHCAKLSIRTIKMDLNEPEWNFPKAAFDVVVAAELLEHLYYPDEVLRKISAVLKPGGLLVGSIPNAFSAKNRLRLFLAKKTGTPLEDPTHINHFSYQELQKLFEERFSTYEIIPFTPRAWLKPLAKIVPGLTAFMFLFWARK